MGGSIVMASTSFLRSSIYNGNKYNDFLVGNESFFFNSFESIATVTGTGSSATITFNSIPSTYKSLQIRMLGKRTNTFQAAQYYTIRVNGDTGSNYAYHQMDARGTSAVTTGSSSTTGIISPYTVPDSNSALNNMFYVGIIDILDYANTSKNKTIKSIGGLDTNNTSSIQSINLFSGVWLSTAAVTSISIISSDTNWTSSSTFALYGIKG